MTTTWTTAEPVTAVCVTGMHRSGTSFAMRTLHLLGVDIGAEADLMPPGPDNRAGYWENRLVKEYDDELLAHLGGAWDRPPLLAPGWELDADLDPWRERAAAILDRSFADAAARGGTIGVKDPRISLLLPFWRTVVPVSSSVVIVREPREVVASLGVRNGFDPAHAALLWLRYLTSACTADPGHLLLSHQAFFDDLPTATAALVRHFGLDAPSATAEHEIAAHLDPGLRHHVAPAAADASTVEDAADPVVRLAVTVWNHGRPDLDLLPPLVVEALAQGWFQPPSSADDLRRARADAVDFKEQLRARNTKVRALADKVEALTIELERLRPESPSTPPGSDG